MVNHSPACLPDGVGTAGFYSQATAVETGPIRCLDAGSSPDSIPQSGIRAGTYPGNRSGTDLVLYAFMLCTICVLFHLYGKQFVMSRNLVELARREALRTPAAGRGLDRRSVHSTSELNEQQTEGGGE